MIHDQRLKILNNGVRSTGDFVLYWMQAAQRTRNNHALEHAIRQANQKRQPLAVFFGLTDAYPEANARHYRFMLEGLVDVQRELRELNAAFIVRRVSPAEGILQLADRASLIVTDRGYTTIQKRWRARVAERVENPFVQIETDVVVPVETASHKEEYSAATLRRKITPLIDEFLVPFDLSSVKTTFQRNDFESLDLTDPDKILAELDVDQNVNPSPVFRGGSDEAERRLTVFLNEKLDDFDVVRNDPTRDGCSNLSPYLHFGQISPSQVALRVRETDSPSVPAFLEELIVRRELAMNFVHYNPQYNSFTAIPEWARKTLSDHADDEREFSYALAEFENAATHDPFWNAAQNEMVLTGKMSGYMRMYWGKKIIEWSETSEKAFATALHLNNKFELDGRDPNGFAGVAWCFGKHDRPWAERPVFGKTRYMNANGLKRKFDIDAYVRKIEAIRETS